MVVDTGLRDDRAEGFDRLRLSNWQHRKAWQLIETWTGTVEAFAAWQLIETWTGTIEAPAAWQLVETWTGTIEASAAWQLIETWTGTVSAPAALSLVNRDIPPNEVWGGVPARLLRRDCK